MITGGCQLLHSDSVIFAYQIEGKPDGNVSCMENTDQQHLPTQQNSLMLRFCSHALGTRISEHEVVLSLV